MRDGELWRLWYTSVPSPEGMAAEIERRLALQAAGSMLPFTVLDAAGRVVGMTTYMNIDAAHRRVEIGSTWTAPRRSARRSTRSASGCCSAMPSRRWTASRWSSAPTASTRRAGAPSNAWARSSTASCARTCARADGSLRDTAVYSITAAEWPAVRSHLDWQLARPR